MANKRMTCKKVQIICCGALAREVIAACQANDLGHVEIVCLPALWHNHPERIAAGVEAAIEAGRAKGFSRFFVAYADCGTGGALDAVCDRLGVTRLAGPHCYATYSGVAEFAKRADDDMRTFFLTDFLARQFEAFVVEPLGLDRHPELRDAYFAHYEKLVYLAQTDDPALLEKARGAAATLGLAFEHRRTGLGDLPAELRSALA